MKNNKMPVELAQFLRADVKASISLTSNQLVFELPGHTYVITPFIEDGVAHLEFRSIAGRKRTRKKKE